MPYYPIFIPVLMDLEYLEHIKGSPYITEGKWDQFKAKAAQQAGAFGAMAGHQIQDPTETKLRSLWEGFIRNVKSAMKDWEEQVSPMFDTSVEIDANGQQLKSALDNLSRIVLPLDPRKMGMPSQGGRNQRDNPDSYIKGSAYNRSTSSPSSLKSLAPKQNFDIEEGLWDAANRDVKLNKALGSNDPGQILNAYKNYILSLFSGFMKDAVKATKLSAQQIYQKLAKIQPAKSGLQPSGNMQKVVQNLQQLQSVGDAIPKASAGAVPPVIPGQKPSAGAVPPVIGQQPSPAQPTAPTAPTAPKKDHLPKDPTASEYDAPPKGSKAPQANVQIMPQEIPYIILKAIRIIIDAVSSDKSHVGKYFTEPNLPTSFTQDISEIDAPPKSNKPKPNAGADDQGVPFEEAPGEFVYNFHGNFRKFPSTNFSIEVEPVHENPEIEQIPGLSVEVWWSCTDTENEIYAVGTKKVAKSPDEPEETSEGVVKSDPIPIMSFYDHQVNSKAGAANPYDSNAFSVEKIVNQTDPTGEKKLDPTTDAQVISQIKTLQNLLLRSLMVVTARKAKEFKPKTKKVFPITYDDKGNVSYIDPQSHKEVIADYNQVQSILKGDFEKSQAWKETLEHYGYFEKFPKAAPVEPNEYESWKEAETELMTTYGISEAGAKKLLVAAWMDVSKTKSQDQITAEDLINASPAGKNKPSQSQGITWDSKGTIKVKDKNGNIIPIPKDSVGGLDDASKAELEKAGYFKAFPDAGKPSAPPAPVTPAPAKQPVSGPASGNPPTTSPTAPVSKPVGGEPPTTNPTAPVSNAGKEKATADAQQGQAPGQTQQPEKKIWVSDDGGLMFKNKEGEEKPMSIAQAVHFSKKYPKIKQAIADAGIDLEKLASAQSQKAVKPKKKKLKEIQWELNERSVNPFQLSNFL